MILKWTLIGAAVDSVTWFPPLHWQHESRLAFHWSWRRHTGPGILKNQLGRSWRNTPIYLHREEGDQAPSSPAAAPLPSVFLLDIHGPASLVSGKLLPNYFVISKIFWALLLFWNYLELNCEPWKAQVPETNCTAAPSTGQPRRQSVCEMWEQSILRGSIFYMRLLTHKLQYISSHFDNSWGLHLPLETPAGPIMRIINNMC